ncbi:nucleoporin NDC1-like [Maniola hyperantus]|uniref:nucleoporin NDC1-like n=1 Tax=Aphantopus hyperantus TaxID=2795564 RepID=UPI0015689695|nr:nucleoporin NDC1 [Maniola hyperantus]
METKSEIFAQRLIKAVIWNIFLQTIIAILLVFFIQVDLVHPVTWVSSTLDDIFSWKMSLNIVLLGLVSFFQAYIYGSQYSMPVPKYFTRISMFLNMFSIQNIIFSILYALNGYFTMSLYSSLAKSNFNVFKKKCENYDGQCLLEQSLFLQIGGMWMGLYYFTRSHLLGATVLTFPHIYQEKFQQIKLVISNILSMGFQHSMTPVAYYCVFYCIWGSKPRSVISDVYSLYLEDPPLDNIINLISSGIWIGLWFYTSLFFISIYTMKTVFNIVLTEPMKFPIESNTHMTLNTALSQRLQFTSYLGALDLKNMSKTDPVRRSQIFTLSQPGGHPKNWNSLLEKCLYIITEFNKELDSINGDSNAVEGNSKGRNVFNRVLPPASPPLQYTGTLRNMAQSPKLLELKHHNKHSVDDTFAAAVKEEFNGFLQKLCQKPGISYFFGELVDTKLKFILIQAQPVLWTCEGLACIVSSSLKEDKYGVVQHDLPTVLSAFVTLKQNLDKLTKPGLVPRKHILNDVLAIKIRSALLSSVKRSLYKIVLTFSKYIHEIPLDPDVQTAIQSFILCKEP